VSSEQLRMGSGLIHIKIRVVGRASVPAVILEGWGTVRTLHKHRRDACATES
jgi:hypothetical protein